MELLQEITVLHSFCKELQPVVFPIQMSNIFCYALGQVVGFFSICF